MCDGWTRSEAPLAAKRRLGVVCGGSTRSEAPRVCTRSEAPRDERSSAKRNEARLSAGSSGEAAQWRPVSEIIGGLQGNGDRFEKNECMHNILTFRFDPHTFLHNGLDVFNLKLADLHNGCLRTIRQVVAIRYKT